MIKTRLMAGLLFLVAALMADGSLLSAIQQVRESAQQTAEQQTEQEIPNPEPALPQGQPVRSDPETAAERKFEFKYSASVQDIAPGTTVKAWFPIASSNEQQEVESVSITAPAEVARNADAKYGNQIGFFEMTVGDSGQFEFDVTYHVLRKEAVSFGADTALTEQQKELFLNANSLVPIEGRPVELIENVEMPEGRFEAGSRLYNLVEQHMTYDKSKPGYGNGDSVWACDSKTGNCTDFHSLFISLARSAEIPARFEIGFPLPADQTEGTIGGYHCWAWFHSEEKGWSPVDISEADKHPELKDYYFGRLTADRISMSSGRDIELVPASAGEPLNYFVYPYMEADGEILPREKITPSFSFRNIE